MASYKVEVVGESREHYIVEAENETEAMKRWGEGKFVMGEVSSAEPVSVELIDDDDA